MIKRLHLLAIMLCLLATALPASAIGLTINTSKGSNDVTITKDANNGIYTVVTTGGDPYFYLSALPSVLDATTDSLIIEYKASADVADLQIFFADPISEQRSKHYYNVIKQTDEWTELRINIADAISDFRWKYSGNYMRVDPGSQSGVTLQFRSFYINSQNNTLTSKQKNLIARHIGTYVTTGYKSQVSNVTVTSNEVTITGSCEDASHKYALVEVPPYTDITETTNFAYRTDITDKDFSITLPRFTSRDGYDYDRLLSKWAIADVTTGTDTLVSHARYADEVAAISSPQAQPITTKKGLGGFIWNDNRYDLDSLGIGSVTVNVVLNSIVSLSPTTGYIAHTYGGKTYYMSNSQVAYYDQVFKFCQERGITVSAIILITPTGGDGDYTNAVRHPEYKTGPYTMPNFATLEGVEAYAATIDFLAKRYSSTENGRIHHWILGNEVDMGSYWTNMGSQPLKRYTDTYVKNLRLVRNIVRQYDQNAASLASFTHSWTSLSGSSAYATKTMLEFILQLTNAEGDFWWGLACHPYPQNLTLPEFWKNDTQSTYNIATSGYVTFKNLEVLSEWMLDPTNMYNGTTKRILFLSEQGTNSPSYSDDDLGKQAAGACWAWKKVNRLKGIDAMQWHNWQDNRAEDGLRIGLRYYSDDETHPNEPKPVWYVWKAAGTENEDSVFAPYMSYIGITDWESIFNEVTGAVEAPTVAKASLNVYGTEGRIINRSDSEISVYTITGATVAKSAAAQITLPAGIYVVRANAQSKKVLVR